MKFCASSVAGVLLGLVSSVNGFTTIQPRTSKPRADPLFMANIGLFFGTATGSTEDVADQIAAKLGAEDIGVEGPFDVDAGSSIVESFRKYDALIVGTPTWETGADTQRSGTGWDELYYSSMSELDLTGMKVAVFGLGDSVSYAENYADGTGELHDVFQNLGCKMFGYISQEGYQHADSKSIRGDKFCGLLLDMVNEEEKTEERIEKWIAQLEGEGFFEGGSDIPASVSVVEETVVEANGATVDHKTLEQLDENSSLLDASIGSHDTGFTPHENPLTGRTMWTSSDGRESYFTQGTATATKQSTGGVSP